jgi:hypothetical protein
MMNSVHEQLSALAVDEPANMQRYPRSWWEGLCCWLTTTLKGIEMTLERREGGGEWQVECLSHPLQRVTTHETNGVQILCISADMNGNSKIFEIAGPNSIALSRDPAGFPVKVEIKSQDVQVVLCFSGLVEPQSRHSSNAWGE